MELTILNFQKSSHFGVVQFSFTEKNNFDYISSVKAFRKNLISVSELKEGGSVNNILFKNKSKNFVFFLQGDILEGALQNRTVNTSVLIKPECETIIPVSCVEAGRWNYRDYTAPKQKREKFKESPMTTPVNFKKKMNIEMEKNLKAKRGHYSNQGERWSDIDKFLKSHKITSNSSDLSEVYYSNKMFIDQITPDFTVNKDANGLAIFYKDKIESIDIFNRTDVYEEYFPKLINSAVVEFNFTEEETKEIGFDEVKYKTLEFFDKIKELDCEEYNGVGVGTEKRFKSKEITGFELEYDSHLIHLTAMNLN